LGPNDVPHKLSKNRLGLWLTSQFRGLSDAKLFER
jgi:hypothetical protein